MQETIAVDMSSPGELASTTSSADEEARRRKIIAQAEAFGVAADDDQQDRLPAALRALREELPAIIDVLVHKASEGDVEAAKACIEVMKWDAGRLPPDVKLKGSIEDRVKQILSAMAERKIDPHQTLTILQSFTSAKEALKGSRHHSKD